MKIISLPPILPGDLDLAEINQQIKQGNVQLDWSMVQSASEDNLAVLSLNAKRRPSVLLTG